ncbi:Methylthioribose kinase [compost metagenome]
MIDPEFAFYGPMGFDLGAVIANLLLNYASQPGWSSDMKTLEARRDWLLSAIRSVWEQFEYRFRTLWNDECQDPVFNSTGYQDFYIRKLLQDSIGFAGCKVIRRIVGLSHVADIDAIADESLRHQAKITALQIGTALIKGGRSAQSIEEVILAARTAAEKEGVAI